MPWLRLELRCLLCTLEEVWPLRKGLLPLPGLPEGPLETSQDQLRSVSQLEPRQLRQPVQVLPLAAMSRTNYSLTSGFVETKGLIIRGLVQFAATGEDMDGVWAQHITLETPETLLPRCHTGILWSL